MDPAMFPARVPEVVAWIAMGGGLVAGVLATTWAFLWSLGPEDRGRVLPTHSWDEDAALVDRSGRQVYDAYPGQPS
jgi:hypothetical protein